jgi:hypothetical protein
MKKRTKQQSVTHAYYMPKPSTLPSHKPIASMTPDEARTWRQGLRDRLLSKMQRERAYLDRRAKRGVQTPTDDAYEADQLLEAELLALLDHLDHHGSPAKPTGSSTGSQATDMTGYGSAPLGHHNLDEQE